MPRPNARRKTISPSGRNTITASAKEAIASSTRAIAVFSRESPVTSRLFLVLAVLVAGLRGEVEDIRRHLVAAHRFREVVELPAPLGIGRLGHRHARLLHRR